LARLFAPLGVPIAGMTSARRCLRRRRIARV